MYRIWGFDESVNENAPWFGSEDVLEVKYIECIVTHAYVLYGVPMFAGPSPKGPTKYMYVHDRS